METKEIVKKIAELLYKDEGVYNGVVCFDHSSYDNALDIPSINIDGELVLIEEFRVSKDGNIVTVIDDDGNAYTVNLDNIPEEWDDEYFERIGFDTLLRDVFYETDYSWEIGDFEIDFLGI